MNHKLLVAVDGGATSAHTVAYVGRACAGDAHGGAAVVLFHVLPPLAPDIEAGQSAAAAHSRERVEADAEQAGQDLLARMKERMVRAGATPASVALETEQDDGNVPAQIVAAAQRHACDTIVIGRRGQSMVGQFFAGSVVEHLLRHPIGLTVWVVE